jgi:hypothetical protein
MKLKITIIFYQFGSEKKDEGEGCGKIINGDKD